MATFLHVGCGNKHKNATTRGYNTAQWNELRLDIDPKVKPDVVGSITHMHAVKTASIDAIYSSHNIEHLNAYEVPKAMSEFVRVLHQEGFLVLTCPDLQSVAELIAQDKLMKPAYNSAAGPICPLDMVFGLQTAIAKGNHYMAHRCGFTQKVLVATLKAAGFVSIASARRPAAFDLWVLASKIKLQGTDLQQLALSHFPDNITANRKPVIDPQAVS